MDVNLDVCFRLFWGRLQHPTASPTPPSVSLTLSPCGQMTITEHGTTGLVKIHNSLSSSPCSPWISNMQCHWKVLAKGVDLSRIFFQTRLPQYKRPRLYSNRTTLRQRGIGSQPAKETHRLDLRNIFMQIASQQKASVPPVFKIPYPHFVVVPRYTGLRGGIPAY